MARGIRLFWRRVTDRTHRANGHVGTLCVPYAASDLGPFFGWEEQRRGAPDSGVGGRRFACASSGESGRLSASSDHV
jgi:hypothetical protein